MSLSLYDKFSNHLIYEILHNEKFSICLRFIVSMTKFGFIMKNSSGQCIENYIKRTQCSLLIPFSSQNNIVLHSFILPVWSTTKTFAVEKPRSKNIYTNLSIKPICLPNSEKIQKISQITYNLTEKSRDKF